MIRLLMVAMLAMFFGNIVAWSVTYTSLKKLWSDDASAFPSIFIVLELFL